jgi:hypothetical protein
MKKTLTQGFLFLFLLSLTPRAEAIPAFARKYRISCQVCHSPSIPKLKPYGDEVAGAGFRLKEYQAPGYFVNTGDDKLSLLRDLPIAVRIDGFATYNFGNSEQADFGAPYLIKLLSGGELSDHLSYYFYFLMDERGEIAGVEDAYLMYNNLFNTDLDIYVGQFQVSDPLFKRELRLSLEDYQMYKSEIGLSNFNLEYDRGVMITWGLPTSTDLIVEVVNGNGLAEANPSLLFDKDKYKNVFTRISQDIGDYLRIGVAGYFGKENIDNSIGTTITNSSRYIGPDATLRVGDKWELNAQYLMRNDSHILIEEESDLMMDDVGTQGALGELIFSPKGDASSWYALAMFNWVESDFDPADYRSATIHAGYLLRRNVRLAAEYTQIFTDPDNTYGRVSLGFVSAF